MRRRTSIVALLASTAQRVFVTWSYMVLRPGFVYSGNLPGAGSYNYDKVASYSTAEPCERTHGAHHKIPMEGDEFDFVVIGGGCAGMAAAKEAARLGAKTLLFDHVKPTPHGTTWGLGGTCVNVGCIPKKLMHYAGILGHSTHDREMLGWSPAEAKHDWRKMVQTVQNYIKMLNFSYRSSLLSNDVTYVNAYAVLEKNNQVSFQGPNGITYVKAKHILIAIGTRPVVPEDVPGATQFAITSDDLMSMTEPVGKTLIVGGSFVALECAGLISSLGFDVTVAVRSVVLRGFDRQCADKVVELMEHTGTKFRRETAPKIIRKLSSGQIEVVFDDLSVETFDTVMYATGRRLNGLYRYFGGLGVRFGKSGRILTHDGMTDYPYVYAAGDVVEDNPSLATVAIKDGETLARRIFSNSTEKMDLNYVPMCVFTPFEYGKCGLSEEEAIEKYGDDVEVYLKEFTTLELSAVHREKVKALQTDEFDTDLPPTCLSKMVCRKDGTVLGVHFVGPNAGEIIQGMCVAVRMGAKKQDFDSTIGVHPTDAESFMTLTVTKSSGESWVQPAGCGGGRCG